MSEEVGFSTMDLWRLIALAVLFVVNGLFVAAEFALVKIRETQLAPLVARGNWRARFGQRLIANLDSSISATQLGITLAGLGVGAMVEPVFSALLAPVFHALSVESIELRRITGFVVGFLINTFVLIVAGELGPKALAIRKTLPVLLWVAAPLQWFIWLTYPFIWLLNRSAQALLRLVGIEVPSEAEQAHSEEELRLLLATAQKHAAGSDLGRAIVLNAFDLKRRVVRDVMRPRKEIVTLDIAAGVTECLDVADETRYSRFPLCEDGDPDRTLGVVHVKDLFAMRLKARTGADLAPVAKKLIFVPETARLESLLRLFLERRLHFALVVDEYGTTVGMATLENILEELVGQIQDEFDAEKPLVDKKGEHVWELSGALPLHQLSDLVGEIVAEDGVTTTSGLVTQRLGGFAKSGDRLALGNCELTVEETDGPRVTRLKLARRVEPPAGET
jgi:CBS domain containing-hemolysin-like protein